MWIFGSLNKQLNRVPGGRKEPFACENCKATTTFYECLVDEHIKAYFVLKLWGRTKRIMQCGECLAACDYYYVFPKEKEAEEKAVAERQRREAEAEAKRRDQEEAARKAREEAEIRRREEQRRADEAKVDDELAALKHKLGK
jgi:hypothetical protein